MSDEEKQRLKDYQKNYRGAKKSKLILNRIFFNASPSFKMT